MLRSALGFGSVLVAFLVLYSGVRADSHLGTKVFPTPAEIDPQADAQTRVLQERVQLPKAADFSKCVEERRDWDACSKNWTFPLSRSGDMGTTSAGSQGSDLTNSSQSREAFHQRSGGSQIPSSARWWRNPGKYLHRMEWR